MNFAHLCLPTYSRWGSTKFPSITARAQYVSSKFRGIYSIFKKKMFFDSICSGKLKTSALLTNQGLSSIEFSSFVCALSFCSYLKMHFITKDDKEKKIRK